ncbi:MAG TPA: DUF4369 domain-containing protein [Bacteroidaceae bacterium]|nr:DUF4369 domain-containing protein [Bacteroidaceae bacterium]
MKKYITSLSLITILFCTSCARPYYVEGSVDLYGYEGSDMGLFMFENSKFIKIDSAPVKHGKFYMTGTADTVMLVELCRGTEPIMPIFIEPGKIKISIKPSSLKVSGTEQNDLLYSFLEQKVVFDNRYEDLMQRRNRIVRISGFSSSAFREIEDSIAIIITETENLIVEFIKKNYNRPVGLGVFSMVCYAMPTPVVTPIVKRILDDAPENFMQQTFVKDFVILSGYEPSGKKRKNR